MRDEGIDGRSGTRPIIQWIARKKKSFGREVESLQYSRRETRITERPVAGRMKG